MIEVLAVKDIQRIADWIELYVLSEQASISKRKVLSVLESHITDIAEEDVDSAILELIRRLTLYGKVKPYEITGDVITRKFDWRKHPEHTLCLYYSTYGAAKPDKGTKLFEKITQGCLEKELHFKTFLLGFPAKKPFKEQLDSIAGLIREKRHENPSPQDKDRGVDIIAWKEFDEHRDNVVLMFVQCAAGKHWSDKKVVAIDSYRRFFSFTLKATLPSLSITQVIDLSEWRNATDDYGLLIDRARIFRIITSSTYKTKAALRKELVEWCSTKLKK